MADTISWDELYPFIDEVKAMARGLLRRESHAESLQATALVVTALRRQRSADQDWSTVTWQNRQYFFGAMYQAMQRALIDHGRHRAAQKRRAEVLVRPEELQLLNLKQTMAQDPAQVVALVEALVWLKGEQPQWVEALEYRFYGGLTVEETARMMAVDERTIRRWWDRSQLILRQKITASLNAEKPEVPRP